jgi:hypothetical protein
VQSQNLGWHTENVTRTTLRFDELRVAWIGLQLATLTENLNVDAAIENLFVMHAARGEQLLAAQYLLRPSTD